MSETHCVKCQHIPCDCNLSDIHKALDVINLDLIQSQGTGVVLTDTYFLRQLVDSISQLERENQQLRDGLKVCKEALKQINHHDTHCGSPFKSCSAIASKALSHPAVQAALKEKE